MNNLDNNIVESDNFNTHNFLLTLGCSLLVFACSQLIYWCLYLRHFHIKSLDTRTGKRVRFKSLVSLWKNCFSLIRYYWGLARSKTSGRFSKSSLGTPDKSGSREKGLGRPADKDLLGYKSGQDGIHQFADEQGDNLIETGSQQRESQKGLRKSISKVGRPGPELGPSL